MAQRLLSNSMVPPFTYRGIPARALLRTWSLSAAATRHSDQILSGAASAPMDCQETPLRQVAPRLSTRQRTRPLTGDLLLLRVGTRITYFQKPILAPTTPIRPVLWALRLIRTRQCQTALLHPIGFSLLPGVPRLLIPQTVRLLEGIPMLCTLKGGCST